MNPSKNVGNKSLFFLVVLLLAAGVGATAVWLLSTNVELAALFDTDNLLVIALILPTTLLNIGLRFVRWHLLVRSTGASVPTRSSARIFAMGLAMVVTPLYVGEIIKSLLLVRNHRVGYRASTGVISAERAWDILAIAFLGAFWFMVRDIGVQAVVPILGTAVALLITGPFIATYVANRLKIDLDRNQTFGSVFLGSFAHAGRSTPLALLSAGAWTSAILGLKFASSAFGHELDFFDAAAAFAAGTYAGVLSLFPGGVGVAGSVQIGVLTSTGVLPSVASSTIFFHRIFTIWFSFSFGLIVIADYIRTRSARHALKDADHFDSISEVYSEQLPVHLQTHILGTKLAYVDDVFKTLSHDVEKRVLDVGCGGGEYSEAVGRWPKANVLGVDASSGQIERATARVNRASDHDFSHSNFEVADMTQLPVDSESIDIAFAINSLHHLPDRETQQQAFTEVQRVLKPGASFMLFEMNIDSCLVRNYLNYLFPLLRNIDDGTEEFISPGSVQNLTAMKMSSLNYFGFTPDFLPPFGLPLVRAFERRLEHSRLSKSSVHYVARFTKT